MWWKKTKVFSKQRLKEANLDPVPFVKERVRSEFARTVLEPLPITQTDLGDEVEFKADALVLSLPQWQTIKADLLTLSEAVSPDQRETIANVIATIEAEAE
ncbi:hypothetical protein [Spirosoma linguale]|uniref:Uncharacterized protein n=2 Tax=Spirosoma TaxID=107 RepID=D2QF57_SPILD|nr:hypothetical protein Slin_0470 [Spirosoma linguale DSM 74]